MSIKARTVEDRARIMWYMRLQSAFRTALACAIVGVATFFGPKFLTDQIKFVSFSYLTVVLIVFDATLGDTLRGCWHAFHATCQVVPLSMLTLWIIDPKGMAGLPVEVAALGVGVAAFFVALPESTHLTTKRIAFGQIVLVCVDAVTSNDDSKFSFMPPVHVATSTALGTLASFMALVLPFPGLAHHKVEKLCKVYAENASERMSIYLKALNAKDRHARTQLVSQAKPIAETGTKLLQNIRITEEGIQWECPWSQYTKATNIGPGDRLQRIELSMRGIEYSLASSPAFPAPEIDRELLTNILQSISGQLQKKLEQARSPLLMTAAPDSIAEFMGKLSSQLEPIFPIQKYEWTLFFFSCIDMLLSDTIYTCSSPYKLETQVAKKELTRIFKTWISRSRERLGFAFRCSVSLGMAVLFGLIFDRGNGRWAGLTIAISFVTGRHAVFTIANTRAQGTAIGSIYGVICCFLFRSEGARLFVVLPWIVFTSFLRHSRMYSQTGGISAAIGALLILGRKNYGDPDDFAIARLTMVFIGLSSFVVVELFMQPTRAATLARSHLYMTLHSVQDCIKRTEFFNSQKSLDVTNFHELREKQRIVESLVCELKVFVADASMEPDFWYMPFRTSCYQNLVGSLTNVVNILYFLIYNLEILSQQEESCTLWKDSREQTTSELELSVETLSSLLKYMEMDDSIESQVDPDVVEEFRDLEAGTLQDPEQRNASMTEDEMAEFIILSEENDSEEKIQIRERIIRCAGAMRFCVGSLRKEIEDVDVCIKEIIQRDHNSSQ